MSPLQFGNLEIELIEKDAFILRNRAFKSYQKTSIPILLLILIGWFFGIFYFSEVWHNLISFGAGLFIIYITFYWGRFKKLSIDRKEARIHSYSLFGKEKLRIIPINDVREFSCDIQLDNIIGTLLPFLRTIHYYLEIERELKPVWLTMVPFMGSYKKEAHYFCNLLNRIFANLRKGKELDLADYDPKEALLRTLPDEAKRRIKFEKMKKNSDLFDRNN